MSNKKKNKLQLFLNNVSKKLKEHIKIGENHNSDNIIQKPVKEKNIGRVLTQNIHLAFNSEATLKMRV